MDLNTLWFILIAVLYSGYFFLEGFDLGVGILLPFISKDDIKRRVIINSIGPHWDGNEVWLITAGAASFAAFPEWYATLFSSFYIPFFLMLIALIIRGVAFEFRSKEESTLWRSFWDWSLCVGSFIPSFLWGIAFSNIISGVPIDITLNYIGGFWNLLNPFALLGGLLTVIGFSLHGAIFITLKTTDELMHTAKQISSRMWPFLLILILGYFVFVISETDIFSRPSSTSVTFLILTIISILAIGLTLRYNINKISFIFSSLGILLTSATIFLGLYPRLMISNINANWSLNIYNSSSSPYTLRIMSIVAVIFIPLILMYQGWSYWVFRKRLSVKSGSLEY